MVLGATYPGDNPAHLTDALRQLGDRGAYMNRDQDRYWLSLQQTVSRIVQDRADGYDVSEIHAELTRLLRLETDRGVFERVHRVPAATGDVDDEPAVGLVIFGMDRPHSRKANTVADAATREFLERRGTQPRIHKNSLVFLAPDVDRIDTLDSVIRRKLAWASIKASATELNLDQHNIAVVNSRLAQAEQAVADTIREAYKWIIIPFQEPGSSEIELESIIMNGDGTLAARVTKKADTSEFVLRHYTPTLLRGQIDRLHLWDKQPHVVVETLCGYFTQYLYMPRITTQNVIKEAIKHLNEVLLPQQDGFAYADSLEDGRYRGLALAEPPAAVSAMGLVVDPQTAQCQIDEETIPGPGPGGGGSGGDGGGSGSGETDGGGPVEPPLPPGVPPVAKVSRFHGTKSIDPTRAVRDISQISDEILALFTTNGVPVQISVDIESSAIERLTAEQITALRENLATLGFNDWNVE